MIRGNFKEGTMSTIKTALIFVVIFVLASCSLSTTTTVPTHAPTPKPTAAPTPKPTAAPVPDVPIYQNSFEDITDLVANGITSNGDVALDTENFNYPGGGTALKIGGTLPGAQYSSLYVDLSFKKLIGQDSVDLTDKTIYYSAFIPADSAIDNISIYAGKGNQFVFLAGITSGTIKNDYWKKGIWQDYHFDLSHAAFMRGTDTIRIVGSRESSGNQATAYFLVDDLKWIRSDSYHIPVNNSIDSLRKYAVNKHFYFGLFDFSYAIFGSQDSPFKNTVYDTKDPWYAYEIAQEGVVSVVEDFYSQLNPGEDYSNFNYNPVKDAIAVEQYNFGKANSMTVLGYTSSYRPPDWIRNLDYPDATKALLLYHIEKELRLTQGQKPVWILFNEFTIPIQYGGKGLRSRQEPMLGIDGYDYGDEGHYSPWAGSKTDSSLIEAAIIKAHEVDPGATLLLNDWNDDEQIGLKTADYLYQFASGLKDKGIPIDGVGFQMHNSIEPGGTLTYMIPFTWPWQWEHINLDTWLKNVDLNVKRYASKGLKVAFTEVEGQIKISDIDFNTPEGRAEYDKRLQWQAKYYAGLLKIAMVNDNVIMFHTWGVTDRYQNGSSDEGYGNGLIFDKNFNPKPAYDAMLKLLKGQ
jgi:hypothetical protein